MDLSPDLKNALFAVAGTVGGGVIVALILAIPAKWKSWKQEVGDEALHREAELRIAREQGVQSQRITDLSKDLGGVADMVRKRFDGLEKRLERRFQRLEKQDAALETLVTRELPKFEDEDTAERSSCEQAAIHG